MNPLLHPPAPVLVVGAGLMGSGIAQVAAQAGHAVALHDTREGVAEQALTRLRTSLDGGVAKGRWTADEAAATLGRIRPVATLAAAGDAAIAIEAIVEQLDDKRALLRALEALLGEHAILASNTSSISITALAAGLQRPGRVVGMHFFNPVPQMKLVEVVAGLQTDPAVAEATAALARAWGKTAVHAKSTPGFIVNRIARPYYAEALALLHEQASTPERIDAALRGAGFRMGPCELMDLIGHDTNFAVTQSVFEAFFHDRRYAPSPLQREMVAGGLLGRKAGRGFYSYPAGVPPLPVAVLQAPASAGEVTVHGQGALAEHLLRAATAALAPQGWGPARHSGHSGASGINVHNASSDWTGLSIDGAQLRLSDGRSASEIAHHLGRPDIAVFDRVPLADRGAVPAGTALAYSVAAQAGHAWRTQAGAWLAALGFAPLAMADTPGLVVTRTLAMLINEAADAVQQGVCTPEGADAAMKLGVAYPAGPFEWLAGWSACEVLAVLQALDAACRGDRYRASPWLRERAWTETAAAG